MTEAHQAPLRFAVLRHDGIEGPHVDFLYETAPGSMLQTWRLPTWPIHVVEEATRIRDHRPAFLTYQGQLTGDRGTVLRIDEGKIGRASCRERVAMAVGGGALKEREKRYTRRSRATEEGEWECRS